jgi:cardiolipin synthase A/B
METFFLILAVACIAWQLLLLVLALFEPGLDYGISDSPRPPTNSPEFGRMLGALADSLPHGGTRVDVLVNGDIFYEAELAAIRRAKSHICLEAYIFHNGEIAGQFIAALAERARAGVKVCVVLDSVGSFQTGKRIFHGLEAAGGQVRWYMPLRWYTLPRLNHRTHRELLIVDGKVGFVGGAGIADHWYKPQGRRARWRDTMFRVQGRAVASLQSLFAENWLEASGELLVGSQYYPEIDEGGSVAALVINSSPSLGRCSRARMVFQTLIASAARTIYITTPYFLPDQSARRILVDSIRKRGVEVKILVPGKDSDHLLTRRSSRRLYGELLRHGAQIYEYQPTMLHTKSLVVDGVWSVVGSTNFDHRSFGLNDEVNLAALDEGLASRLQLDFQMDLAHAHRITYAEWRRRPFAERVNEWLGWILERQE